MADELVDIVNENGEVVGTAMKSECHKNPALIHTVVHCWIFNREGKVLLQKRAMTKETLPGLWDISVAGHIMSGENHKDAVKRELSEEMGVEQFDAKLVGTYLSYQKMQTELVYLYYGFLDKNIEDLRIQIEEVDAVDWFDMPELMVEKRKKNTNVTGLIFRQWPMILESMIKEGSQKN